MVFGKATILAKIKYIIFFYFKIEPRASSQLNPKSPALSINRSTSLDLVLITIL